ncbi:hypothetical protein N431DRAFT_531228 [Stipitochalara longipes BDJ]|nr:hypothetical protein N431DRAFT_531228 [Stipitochalara longipes BDJ]
MDFDPVNSLFGSPPRDGHACHQNQTYDIPPSNEKVSSSSGETLLQSAKTQTSSVRVTRGINLNLLSRISKFEALDALSMPIKLPSLRPAHLQVSRNSSLLKGTETSHRKRLSTIFSPSSEKRDEYTRIEDEAISEQDILASFKSRKWFSPKPADSRMQNSEASNTSAKIKMCGGMRDATAASDSKDIGTVASPYVQNEIPSRKKSMGDMIKLYDGSSDKVVSKSNSHLRISSLANSTF